MSNTIVRAPRRHRFVIIDQRAVEETRLSWAARGLLGYLLSRPQAYGLSMQGWMHRARDLGVVSQAAFQAMYRMFAARGWRKQEPGPGYKPEVPKLFMQLVFHACAEDLIGESKAAVHLPHLTQCVNTPEPDGDVASNLVN
jgi:hypothetical protein